MRKLLVFLLIALNCGAQQALPVMGSTQAASFSGHYLDAISGSGSDSNNGLTPSTAWATCTHADATLTANDPTLHVRHADGNYYPVDAIWHNCLASYDHVYPSLAGLSATTCYDDWNGHNGTLTGTGGSPANGPIYKYAGMVIADGAYCSVPNFSNLLGSVGAVVSVQTNFYDVSQSTFTGAGLGIFNGSTALNLYNPYVSGTAYFNWGTNINYTQDPIALANQQHAWAGICTASNQYYYLDTTQKVSGGACSFSLSSVALNIGYLTGGANFGMYGLIPATKIYTGLSTADWLTEQAWLVNPSHAFQHAPTPTYPGTQTKPGMEWNPFQAIGTSATCAQVQANSDALVSGGYFAVGYNRVSTPIPWASGRDGSNNLITDATKCPSGIAAMFSHIHINGELAGCWLTPGTSGFAGQPGSDGFETNDATTCAGFNNDRLLYDVTTPITGDQTKYTTMVNAILATGHTQTYSVVDAGSGGNSPYWAPTIGGVEIQPGSGGAAPVTWANVLADASATDTFYTLPWTTPSPRAFVVGSANGIGDGTLTDQEGESNMALLAIQNAGFALGFVLGSESATTKITTQNKEVIDVGQDVVGNPIPLLREQFDSNLVNVRVRQVFDALGGASWIFAITNADSTSQAVTIHWDAGTALSNVTGSFYRRSLFDLWPSSCTTLGGGGYTCATNLDSSPITGATGFTVTVPSHGTWIAALCSSQCTAL